MRSCCIWLVDSVESSFNILAKDLLTNNSHTNKKTNQLRTQRINERTNQTINSKQLSPPWEANNSSRNKGSPPPSPPPRSNVLEPKFPVLCSQEPANCHYSKRHKSILILKINFKIILPSMPRAPKWPISFRFSYQNSSCFSLGTWFTLFLQYAFYLIQETSRQQLGWTLPDTVNTVMYSRRNM
jgi:hypothetical protein